MDKLAVRLGGHLRPGAHRNGLGAEITPPARRRAFTDAASWFTPTAAHAYGRYDEAALGVWSVRDLIGHTSRALLTVESYLASP